MAGSTTEGVKTILHPVTDLAAAKAVYTALLGIEPQADAPYYVGYEAEGQQIGLVPGGGPQAHDDARGLLARGGHRGEAGRGDGRRRRREGRAARRRWRPPRGHVHRPGRQRPRAGPGPLSNRTQEIHHGDNQDEHRRRPARPQARQPSGRTKSGPRCRRARRERKAASRRDPAAERAEGEADVRAKIADMPTADRVMGERIHELVTTSGAVARAEDVLRDAGVRQGRQGRSASSSRRRSSRSATRRSSSSRTRGSTTARCGRSRSP